MFFLRRRIVGVAHTGLVSPGMATGYRPWASGRTGAWLSGSETGQPRRQLVLRVERLLPGDLLARLGRHASQDAHHGCHSAAFRFVIRLILSNGGEQQIVFVLIGAGVGDLLNPFELPHEVLRHLAVTLVDSRMRNPFAQHRHSLRAMDHVAKKAPAPLQCRGLVRTAAFHRQTCIPRRSGRTNWSGSVRVWRPPCPWADTGQAPLIQQQMSRL